MCSDTLDCGLLKGRAGKESERNTEMLTYNSNIDNKGELTRANCHKWFSDEVLR